MEATNFLVFKESHQEKARIVDKEKRRKGTQEGRDQHKKEVGALERGRKLEDFLGK